MKDKRNDSMIYEFDSRIRYSEVNSRQELTLGAIINYFQDCSLFHSEAVGLGVSHLKAKNRAWLLSSWQVVIQRRPVYGQKVTVQTWPYDFTGFYGCRNFSLNGEGGERLVYANSCWIFLDTKTGHPVRVDREEQAGYPTEERLAMDYAPRKIPFPENARAGEGFTIRRHQLDTNGHVNNGQYVLLAQDYLPEDFLPMEIRAEYKKQALLGDKITPWAVCENGKYTVALCDERKNPYATVEFHTAGRETDPAHL